MTNDMTPQKSPYEPELQAILDAAVDAIVIIDDRGIIEAFSHAAEKTFGFSAAELIGKNVNVLMPSPYREEHDGYMKSYKESNHAKVIGIGREVTARKKDGTEFPVELSVGEARDDKRRRFVGIIRDMTEQVRAHEEINDLRAQLAHAGRIEAMGQLGASIAHELNQPLAAIASYSQACRRMLDDGDLETIDFAACADKITEQALHAGQIIHGIRSFSRRSHSEHKNCDVSRLIFGVVNMVKFDVKLRHTNLVVNVDDDIPEVSADRIQIQQVILNLILNGLESMEDTPVDERHLIVRASRHGDEGVRVEVEDSGAGVDEAAARRLFDPYFTTKTAGVGLGLSICRSIIGAHGGTIGITPKKDRGSRFFFTLPGKEDE